MKSQGLPLNFIVLAALAILILILAAAFVMMGSKSIQRSMNPQTAHTNCRNICLDMQNYATTISYASGTGMSSMSDEYNGTWCAKQDIQGVGTVDCPGLGETCYVIFKDDIQKEINCPILGSTSSTTSCACESGYCNSYCTNSGTSCTSDSDCT